MLENIKEIIANELGVDIQEIMDDSDIVDDLGADSLAVVDIVMALEDTYGIFVADEEIIDIRTPMAIVEYIEKNS